MLLLWSHYFEATLEHLKVDGILGSFNRHIVHSRGIRPVASEGNHACARCQQVSIRYSVLEIIVPLPGTYIIIESLHLE